MLAHKLNHPVAGAALVIAAIAATLLVAWQHPASHQPAVKTDRLERSDSQDLGVSDGCVQAAWPYGCVWQPPSEARETKKHAPKRRQGLFWFLS